MQRDSDSDDVDREAGHREDGGRDRHADHLTALLVRCADGERAALREIYELTAPRLRGLALRITGDRMLADDVLHDVFVRLMESAARFDRERGSAGGFLTMLTRFKAMDVMRGRRREPTLPGPHEDDDASGEQVLASLRAVDGLHLAECLGRLDPSTRRLILLTFGEGRSHGELAKMLSIPLGTVKSAIRRGLVGLRQCLDK